MAAMASLRRFLSPAFYQASAAEFGAMVRTKYIQGNILAQPITGGETLAQLATSGRRASASGGVAARSRKKGGSSGSDV